MSGVRLIMMVMFGCLASLAQAQLNIDLSKASLDTETGNYCVVQKVRLFKHGPIQIITYPNIDLSKQVLTQRLATIVSYKR